MKKYGLFILFLTIIMILTNIFTINALAVEEKIVDIPEVDVLERGWQSSCKEQKDGIYLYTDYSTTTESKLYFNEKVGSTIYYKSNKNTSWKKYDKVKGITVKNKDTVYAYTKSGNRKSDIITIKVKLKVYLSTNYYTCDIEKGSSPYLALYGYKTQGAKIYYTKNGKKPTIKSKEITKADIIYVPESGVIRLLVKQDGLEDSYYYFKYYMSASNAYAKKAGLLEEGNVYGTNNEYALLGKVSGTAGKLYYTLDGTKPTKSSAKLTSNFIKLRKTTTVNFLFVDYDGKSYYFKQHYIFNKNADNFAGTHFSGNTFLW